MFHDLCRDWEARIFRDSLELQRTTSQHNGSGSKRSQSTLENISNSCKMLPPSPIGPRVFGDREDGRRKKLYTSSAFDTTRADDTRKEKPSHSKDDRCSPASPATQLVSLPKRSGWQNTNLTIEIPEATVPKQVVSPGRIRDNDRRSGQTEGIDGHSHEGGVRELRREGKPLTLVPVQRTVLRVTSNLERSLHPPEDLLSYRDTEPNSANADTSNVTSLNIEASSQVVHSKMNLREIRPSRRPFDRMRNSREARFQPKATCGPHQVHFSGQGSQCDLCAMRNSSHKVDKTVSVTNSLSFNVTEERDDQSEVAIITDTSQEGSYCSAGENSLSPEGSNFSRLSAESWQSIESEQELSERETRLLTSSSSSDCHGTTISNGTYPAHYSEDHDPQTIFGVDCHGDLLERMSDENPYSLSVLECCALLQIGADVSKKLSFSRCEQRRVWMSSDFLYLCWSSRKSTTKENQIELTGVTRMRLTDKDLLIEMAGGYSISFVFPSVTTAGLWVRALSCLVPLQANIKVPLGVIIPTEREREEFSLAEDTFKNKQVREYMSVNNYVTLCNPICVPPTMGLKMAFSTTEDRFFGMRYIPKKSICYMLRTRKEIAILKTLSHKHIVKYQEVLEDPERGGMYVICEHLSRGCIADSGNLHMMPFFKEAQVRVMIIDIINALLYLHARRISHGDVRPENVLVAANGEAKLNPIGCIMHDFSSITNKISHIRCRLGSASHAFMAPEQCWLTRAPTVGLESTAADVWGVAVLMFTLLYGKTPFQGSSTHEVQQNICWSTLRFPLCPHVSKESKSLMFQILSNKDPRTRMKLVEVRDHPWFHDYSILSPTSSRVRFPDYFESGMNDSSLTDFSEDDLTGAVQAAKLHITAKKRCAEKER